MCPGPCAPILLNPVELGGIPGSGGLLHLLPEIGLDLGSPGEPRLGWQPRCVNVHPPASKPYGDG